MDGVYYMLMMAGVVWLCVWTLSEDVSNRWRIWWPFDRVDELDGSEDGGSGPGNAGPGEARPDAGAARPWRRRG